MDEENSAYGVHAVISLLKKNADSILEVWVQPHVFTAKLEKFNAIIKEHQIDIHFVDQAILNQKIPSKPHQGVIAILKKSASNLDEKYLDVLLTNLTTDPFLLLLDGVTDPHNLGACLRCAEAAGVHAVIVPKNRSASMNATVRKVSSGASESIPLITVTNLSRVMQQLKDHNLWLVGTTEHAPTTIFKTDLPKRMGLVMGSEGKGLRQLTEKNCDFLVKIPMLGTVSSLNVSVATGICLFEAVRQKETYA